MRLSLKRAIGIAALLAASISISSAFGAGGNPLSFGKPDFEFTGTVYDNVTKQPIEGAYVVAIYREQVVSMAAMNSWCVKTRGMYTAKDGKFRFPVENRKGNSPLHAGAIKPGYFNGPWEFPSEEVWKKQEKDAYSNRDIYLIPQDPKHPKFSYGTGEEYCHHARTREDAAAGAEFLKIQLLETEQFRASEQGKAAVRSMIDHLGRLPSSAGSNITHPSK